MLLSNLAEIERVVNPFEVRSPASALFWFGAMVWGWISQRVMSPFKPNGLVSGHRDRFR